jgi:hypothetical protein
MLRLWSLARRPKWRAGKMPLNRDGLLEWHDDKRVCDSPVSIGRTPICRVRVTRRREKAEHWVAGLWIYLEGDDNREAVKEFTQAFFDQHPEALIALAMVRAAANKFSDQRRTCL